MTRSISGTANCCQRTACTHGKYYFMAENSPCLHTVNIIIDYVFHHLVSEVWSNDLVASSVQTYCIKPCKRPRHVQTKCLKVIDDAEIKLFMWNLQPSQHWLTVLRGLKNRGAEFESRLGRGHRGRKQILVHFELEKNEYKFDIVCHFIAHIYSQIYKANFDIFSHSLGA